MTDHLRPAAPDAAGEVLSVTDLTRRIKRLLEVGVGEVEVEGEISNWTVSARGHAYFTLKDAEAQIGCVLFQNTRARLTFNPENGMQVRARGRLSVYEARGNYQLVVAALVETGQGDLFRRFLALKERLEKEGLFDPARKRPLPALPRRIGIVTSPTGAALRDIIHVITRRFPCVELIVAPALVQGTEAPASIVRALALVNRFHARLVERGEDGIDVLIVGRGGGSIEDLWAFNDESVARAIAASPIPVVSAVGHETDFTIADFAADLRAPTPSAAAEIVVGEIGALREQVLKLRRGLHRAILQALETRRQECRRLAGSWGMRHPIDRLQQAMQKTDDLARRAQAAFLVHATAARRRQDALLQRARTALLARLQETATRETVLRGRLDALNPRAVLARGYGIVSRCRDGRVVTRAGQVRIADHLRIQLSEGELRAAVLPGGEDLFEGRNVPAS